MTPQGSLPYYSYVVEKEPTVQKFFSDTPSGEEEGYLVAIRWQS